MSQRETIVPVGGIWEDAAWTILHDYVVDSDGMEWYETCPHAIAIPNGLRWPRIVKATNKAGRNSTRLCADCLLEGLAQHP